MLIIEMCRFSYVSSVESEGVRVEVGYGADPSLYLSLTSPHPYHHPSPHTPSPSPSHPHPHPQDQGLDEQYQFISTTIQNCLCDHGILISNQSIRESFQKLQTSLHQFKSNKVATFQQKRAQYEYSIVRSIQHLLRHRSDIMIRRTDKSKVFYIGKATDFIQKAADYMSKTEAYQEITSGRCPFFSIFNTVQHLLRHLIRTRALTTKQCNRISPKLDSLELGHYHGLPKPHKVNRFLFHF